MIFESDSFDNHEQVIYCHESVSGLRAIIAIHCTALGPAMGGCRMWAYGSEKAALDDVLRLSQGMSYKNALANLPLGGGKAVIIGDPGSDKSDSLFEAFGAYIERLAGNYITAEDVNVSVADVELIGKRTQHVSGLPKKGRHVGGDPSPKTAYGVFLGILEAVGFQTNQQECDQLSGIRIAVQGLGSVGYHLCRYLHEADAELIVADIDEDRLDRVCAEFHVTPVNANEILYQEVDVIAPCALGAIIDQTTVPKISADIIAGAANNQLATEATGDVLFAQGILYAPDYVINAGGIINAAYEYLGSGDEIAVNASIKKIRPRLKEIFEQSVNRQKATNKIADTEARNIIAAKRDELQSAA
jgi:leucine dehydrogenase